ncbi:MAG: SRPBCC family protein, partial [Burkholderiales bacterium]|nr:SRPBCC family protein [Burkholderiales bacterium]
IPLGIAWEVLTDYPHMTEYIAGLTESRVVSGPDEPLRVLQRGKVTLGWFSHDYEVEREVSLIPDAEIRSRVVRGNMKRFDTTMTVVAEGAATRIRYHSESVPGFWIPPLIGTTLMRRQITEHLAALRTEMQRRHAARSHPPAGSGG